MTDGCLCSEVSLRLKKVQGKKKRDAEAAEAARRAAAEADERVENIEIGGGGGDIIDTKDEDVIF